MTNKRQYEYAFKKYITKQVGTYIVQALQAIRQRWFISLFLVGVILSVAIAACSSGNVDNAGKRMFEKF